MWTKKEITIQSGEKVMAQMPLIISASRSTDIPAFYADWFMDRLKNGYVKWINPFNGVPLYVSFLQTRLVVFWSKNPQPIIKNLSFLDKQNIQYYFQFTLNNYENEGLEANLGSVDKRIETFIQLSETIGKEKVIWRFDPFILTRDTGVNELLKKVEYIGERLKNHTEKLVFSYADIAEYRKVQTNLNMATVPYIEFDEYTMLSLARGLQALNESWGLEIGTCAEKIDLQSLEIFHNKCIDDDLIKKLFFRDRKLMEFLGYELKAADLFDTEEKLMPIKKGKNFKDKGQRVSCGCIVSKDIGQYNTCPHECLYCYANTSVKSAKSNYQKYLNNPNSETITGD